MASASTLLWLTVLGFVSLQCAHGFVHTQISEMSKDCQNRYDQLISSIQAPTLEDEQNCTDLITNATANTDGLACPAQDTLVACFQVITLNMPSHLSAEATGFDNHIGFAFSVE